MKALALKKKLIPQSKHLIRRGAVAGFTMIELMVSVAVFIVIGGAAFSLFSQHAPLFTRQQNLTGLNINMRNAVAQMEMDVINAGSGYYPGSNFPDWPIGVTIQNSVAGSSCYNAATHTYTATCFDQLNVILIDGNTPPGHPTSTGSNCVSTTSSILFATPPTGVSPATYADNFHNGDRILVVKSDGSQMTMTTLSKDGQVAGAKVQLQHNPTGGGGINSSSDDPFGLTTTLNNKLGDYFCPADWVMRLGTVSYLVDATDPTNPTLKRYVNYHPNDTGDVVAEQIIGFKVGASLINATSSSCTVPYTFVNTCYSPDYSRIRSIRVSMIGRTPPNQSGPNKFQNNFDQGNYQIQAISIAINPRNLSMRD